MLTVVLSPSQSWKSPASSWVRHKSAQGTESLGHVPLQGTSTDWHVPWHVVNSCTSCGSRHLSPHWTHSQLVTWYSPCQWKIYYWKYLSEVFEWSRWIKRRQKPVQDSKLKEQDDVFSTSTEWRIQQYHTWTDRQTDTRTHRVTSWASCQSQKNFIVF